MVSFFVYDFTFLIVFTFLAIWFIQKNKHRMTREGWMYLYRTQFGIKKIETFAKKHSGFLHFIKYVIVIVGYFLMGVMVWLLGKTVWTYISVPQITEVIKAPPVAPLVPYFPTLFGMESFFPPFYFTYFLVALAVVAVVHEFSHGIFMKLFRTKIKATGFVFLGPILGAFVEEDRKSFYKKTNFEQRVVLAAGVFANVVFAILFFLLYIGFFFFAFTPSGVAINAVGVGQLNENQLNEINSSGELVAVDIFNRSYYVTPTGKTLGGISALDGIKVEDLDSLKELLYEYEAGDVVNVTFTTENSEETYEVELFANPLNESSPSMDFKLFVVAPEGVTGKFIGWLNSYDDKTVFYKERFDEDWTEFIFHGLWWIAVINILVALFNMLPLGILDGGRFFYLTIESLTKNKRIAQQMYRIITWIILAMFIAMMVIWLYRII